MRPKLDQGTTVRALTGTAPVAFGVSLAAGVIYWRTLCPTIFSGDSGELSAAAWVLGIPHPPGYPLWTLIGWLFCHIPHGEPAWRVNLMSALITAVAVGGFCLLARSMIERTGLPGRPVVTASATGAASLILAFSLNVWAQATVAEVYPLNTLLVVAVLGSMVSWCRRGGERRFVILSGLVGLALSNHHTIFLLGPALVAALLFGDRRVLLRPKAWIKAATAFSGGLLPYLYLPLRSRFDPPLDWGNPETPGNFWFLVTRAQYSLESGTSARSIGSTLAQTLHFLSELADQFTFPFVLVAFLGWILIIRHSQRKIWIPLLLAFLALGPLPLVILNSPLTPFQNYSSRAILTPAFVVFALGFPWAFTFLAEAVAGVLGPARSRFGTAVRFSISAVFLLLFPLLLCVRNWSVSDLSTVRCADDYGHNVLLSAEMDSDGGRGALLFLKGDSKVNTAAYHVMVKGRGSGLEIYDVVGAVFRGAKGLDEFKREQWIGERIRREMAQPEPRPIYISWSRPVDALQGLAVTPRGYLYQVVAEGDGEPLTEPGLLWKNLLEPSMESAIRSDDYFTREMAAHYYLYRARYLIRIGDHDRAHADLLQAARLAFDLVRVLNALGREAETIWPEAAEVWFRESAGLDPDYATPRTNLGRLYLRLAEDRFAAGLVGESVEYGLQALEWEPRLARAHELLGLCAETRGNLMEASIHFRQALAGYRPGKEGRDTVEQALARVTAAIAASAGVMETTGDPGGRDEKS